VKTASIVFLFSLSLIAAPKTSKKDPSWQEKMQSLNKTLNELLPLVVSDKDWSKREKEKVLKLSGNLKSMAHSLEAKPTVDATSLWSDSDPSIGLLASMFSKEMDQSYSALKSGYDQYAKNSLRTVTAYCVACHTRTNVGPSFPRLPLNFNLKKLAPLERARFYSATRQFDLALEEYQTLLVDKKIAKVKPVEWGRALRNVFVLTIRVKKDPKAALEVLNKIDSQSQVPALFKTYSQAWKKSIEAWNKEEPKEFKSEEAFFQEAERLYEAGKARQTYPLDHSADVDYLRATLVYHEMLAKYPKGRRVAEALYRLGVTYDLLEDRMLSPLPQMYLEACIRTSPHTGTAEECYHRYEENIYFGYTGSGGTSIPKDLMKQMEDLRKLSDKEQKGS